MLRQIFDFSYLGWLLGWLLALALYLTASSLIGKLLSRRTKSPPVPVSVNYFPTRLCNKTCGFCFHVAKTSYMLPEEDAKRGLRKLVEAGMKKLNVAGGEPFLFPEFLGNICQYVKENHHLESVSIVTNLAAEVRKVRRHYSSFLRLL